MTEAEMIVAAGGAVDAGIPLLVIICSLAAIGVAIWILKQIS